MSHPARVALLACLVLAMCVAPALAQTEQDARVETLTYSGTGSADHSGSEVYLWQSEPHEFTANVSTDAGFDGKVCLHSEANDASDEALACESVSVPANDTAAVVLSVGEWPANLTGTQAVGVEATSDNGSTVVASDSTSVTVVRTDGDLDEDGLTNAREASLGTGLETADSDGDGLDDGVEVDTYETSPTTEDTDGDGLSDHAEIEVHQTDPTAVDTDGDGLTDADEVAGDTNPTQADSDGDGLNDGDEVNVYETNATSADTDGDGLDDGAEVDEYETNPLRPDTDGDGLSDDLEVNTYGTDPNAVDTDGDGLEDGPEVNEYQTEPANADTDGDGLTDGQEVNTYGTNPTNADTDGDGLEDGPEVHQHGTNPNDVDSDGDGVNDRAEVNDGTPSELTIAAALAVALAVAILASVIVLRSERGPTVPVRRWLPRIGRKAGNAPADATDDPPASEVPLEFLSNEEQIYRLLDEHGGQIHQAEIVEETDWSKSKVSRVLSEMEAEEAIVKVDVGKGNLVTRPEDLPTEARAPFDT